MTKAKLVFSRCGPQLDERTFEEEALYRLRAQLTKNHFTVDHREQVWQGPVKSQFDTIHRATLRIL